MRVDTHIPHLKIVPYGERGLVNALVIDLLQTETFRTRFLNSIHFEYGNHEWRKEVMNLTLWIEPSFSEFGNPDLILICECANENRKHVVFVEAKTALYRDSAIPIREADGEQDVPPAINSSVNGQLTLRYRFAEAFVDSLKEERPLIIENRSLWDNAYSELSTDFSMNGPRKLAKKSVVVQCRELFGNSPYFHFVALTNDVDCGRDIYGPEETRPKIYDSNGDNAWIQKSPDFGSLTWDSLAEQFTVGIFAEQYDTLEKDIAEEGNVTFGTGGRWPTYTQETLNLRGFLHDWLARIQRPYGEVLRLRVGAGSDSYRHDGYVVMKIGGVRNQGRESVAFGILELYVQEVRATKLFPTRSVINDKKFRTIEFSNAPSETELARYEDAIRDILDFILSAQGTE